jgi:hypothetical protein
MIFKQNFNNKHAVSIGVAMADGKITHNHSITQSNETCWCRLDYLDAAMGHLGHEYINGRVKTSVQAFANRHDTVCVLDFGAGLGLNAWIRRGASLEARFYTDSYGNTVINGQYSQITRHGQASFGAGHKRNANGDGGGFFTAMWKWVRG